MKRASYHHCDLETAVAKKQNWRINNFVKHTDLIQGCPTFAEIKDLIFEFVQNIYLIDFVLQNEVTHFIFIISISSTIKH